MAASISFVETSTVEVSTRHARFARFCERIDAELLTHPIIQHNPYTNWFARGQHSREQIKAFLVQFSVFSNQFLVAQLLKTINADSVEGMRASKEILANEIGVVFKPPAASKARPTTCDTASDPELVSTEGTVDGGTFRFRAAHFEWLLRLAERLDLGFNDLGKRQHGTPATLRFCDELIRLYGSEDYLVSQAASYAVENWAAAGFWDDLVAGFERREAGGAPRLPLAFFTWHAKLEAQHAAHTRDELQELYFERDLDEDAFIRDGWAILDAVEVFWDGLDAQQRTLCFDDEAHVHCGNPA